MATRTTLAVVGRGSITHRLIRSLLQKDFQLRFCEFPECSQESIYSPSLIRCSSPAEAVDGAELVFVIVESVEQLEAALLGYTGVISDHVQRTTCILCGPFSPTYIQQLEAKTSGAKNGVILLDALLCVDENQMVKIIVSGSDEALEKVLAFPGICSCLQGGIGAVSKIRMVDNLLFGVHVAAAAEAMVLGAAGWTNVRDLYEIISNAAGCSRAFIDRVPHMLDENLMESEATTVRLADTLNWILEEAKALVFPLPLTAVAHQQFLLASASGYGHLLDAAVVKVWQKTVGVIVSSSSKRSQISFGAKVEEIQKAAMDVQNVGFIGLGAMGFGMATTLLGKKFTVTGFDVYEPTLLKFSSLGGLIGHSAAEVAKDAQILVIMVATEAQVEAALYGDKGAVQELKEGSTVILCSTVSPSFVKGLEQRLLDEGKDLYLVDAPVSGGVKRAANGTLTIMAAGPNEALKRGGHVLLAMSETLYVIDGGAGAGSGVKAVNQLLAGVHIAVAAEGMALGASLGLNTRTLYEVVSQCAGCSWMFIDRVPHMLDDDYSTRSAVNIFVKDLRIVLNEGKRLGIPLPLAAAAHQQFLLAAASGWGHIDDSGVVKIYEKLLGITISSKEIERATSADNVKASEIRPLKSEIFGRLVPEWPIDPANDIMKVVQEKGLARTLVVLDDDPTGTQTVHDVVVLTEWSVESIEREFMKHSNCFFILTNSRALSREKAFDLIKEIATNVKEAAARIATSFTIVLRGDSTLRGHFPEELDAITHVLGKADAWIICPSFPQGGRVTVDDIHYVADDDMLIPSGQTEFAKDTVFGYHSSNLKEWVEEKSRGRIRAFGVAAVSIKTIREGGPNAVCDQLCNLTKGSICIVNVVSERDISVFAAGMLQAEMRGKQFLCRTAATFVSARIGIKSKNPVMPRDLGISKSRNGALIIVGSYVPKTTRQVEAMKLQCAHLVHCLTVHVPSLAFGSVTARDIEINQAATTANALLAAGKDTVIMTSRDLVTGRDEAENLEIHKRVSSALVEIAKRIKERPRYLLAKGGITSSDLATKAMGACQAEVVGQVIAGVPIWKLDERSRHPGIPYIVFPGNVGSSSALAEIVKSWASTHDQIAKDILHAAEAEGYAVGAFNVYNLEAISAIVAAAEAENSPVILQIHPNALKHGKLPLVASCVAAAKSSTVPIAVHFDHGNNEQELLDALGMGFDSIMIDCSDRPFQENLTCTKAITSVAHMRNIIVEAELGRLSGTEDGIAMEEYEEKLTDAVQANEFLRETRVDALAVCIGNVHGKYPPGGPKLKMELLKELHEVASNYDTVLVLHGASGLPAEIVKKCIEFGVRKFNVNTELRSSYVWALHTNKGELLDIMLSTEVAMQAVVQEKLRLFGSSGKASLIK